MKIDTSCKFSHLSVYSILQGNSQSWFKPLLLLTIFLQLISYYIIQLTLSIGAIWCYQCQWDKLIKIDIRSIVTTWVSLGKEVGQGFNASNFPDPFLDENHAVCAQ